MARSLGGGRVNVVGSAEHREVVAYIDAITREAGLNARYRTGQDMVELEQAA